MTARRQPGSHNKQAMRTRLARDARVVAVLSVACLAVTLSVFRSPTTARADGRALTVTPATEFGNQVVFVHWSGFSPAFGVIVQQCKADPSSLADCDTALPFPNSENGNEVIDAPTQPDGTGDAFIEVRPVAQLPALGCSAESPCSLIAYEDNGSIIPPNGLPAHRRRRADRVRQDRGRLPGRHDFDLRAEGEASSSQAFYRWIAGLCTADPSLIVDYTETSSVAGREDFLANQVDVGVTSTAATESELAPWRSEVHLRARRSHRGHRRLQHVGSGHRPSASPISRLSPRLLARWITDTQSARLLQRSRVPRV